MTGTPVPTRPRGGEDLLRQLASAHASYRLYPGEMRQATFVAAVERVARSARLALSGGPFHAEISSARFAVAGEEVRSDETLDRLALACFDRRIEHLHVHAVPSTEELAAFSEFLALPIDRVSDGGGAGAVMRAMGITSITVGEIGQEEDEDDSADLAELAPEERGLWEQLKDPETLAATLRMQGLPADPAGAAHDLYVRFRAIEEILPTRLTARRDFFVRIRQVLGHLPTAVAREFHAIVLTRLASERFAMSFGVNLTDPELVEVLFDLAEYGGPDPMELGRRVVALTDRKGAVIDLIASRSDAEATGLATLAEGRGATLVALAMSEADAEVRTAVADVLSQQLIDVSSSDSVALRDLFPDSEQDRRTLALLALRDYLITEDRRVSVDRVLGAWASAVRGAVIAGDESLVDRLLDVVRSAIPPTSDVFKRDAAERARNAIATPDLVRALLERRPPDAPVESLASSLTRFGGGALAAVLDVLAVEETASARAGLLGLAAALAPGHLDLLADRLGDDRWYVVRNLVTIIGRSGPDDAAASVLAPLANHPEPAVRREMVRSLVASAGAAAVPYLRRMADDEAPQVATAATQALAGIRADSAARALADLARKAQHGDERRAALEALATHPSPAVPDLLSGLASRRDDPPLPRSLRRHAKRLARARTGGDT